MKHWTELRTAFYVADTGSISAAAKALGVHRATVLRHLDILEAELGAKVFLRDSQRYQLTEVGEDMFRVAKLTEEQLQEFARRSKDDEGEITGDLTITAMDGIFSLLLPALNLFSHAHPKVRLRCLSSTKLIKLEYGQAHIAIRTGSKPQDDNYVVLPFHSVRLGLYASEGYLDRYGVPVSEKNLQAHRFLMRDEGPEKADFQQWFNDNISRDQVSLIGNSPVLLTQALVQGLGIGMFVVHESANYPSLRRVLPDISWEVPNWILTHGDLHRSRKVQSFMTVLKSEEYQAQMQTLIARQAPVATGHL